MQDWFFQCAGSEVCEWQRVVSNRFLQRFYDSIVHPRAYLLDGLVVTIGPSTIREKRDRELAVRINPERTTGVAQMSEGVRGEILSGLGGLGWSIPTESPRGSVRRGLSGGKDPESFRMQDRSAIIEHGE